MMIADTMIVDMMIVTMMTKNKKFRHEFKHAINKVEELALSQRLSKLFSHDKFADENGSYLVTSLYFDTPSDKALREKIDGVNIREKFRLRYYNNDLSFIRLEKKAKVNGLSIKTQSRLTLEQIKMLLDGNFDFMLESNDKLLQEFYVKVKNSLLKAKTLVVYDRESDTYIPGNVRVTLDKNVRTSNNPIGDFLRPESNKYILEPGITILEVKYDEFLPEIVKLAVNSPSVRAHAYSKYAVARRFE